MFVLTAEGLSRMNKGLWSTHVVIDAFTSRVDALKKAEKLASESPWGEEMLFITDTESGKMERVS